MEKIVQIVEAIEATKRIPPQFKDITFFGANDIWFYHAVFDDRLCDACDLLANALIFIGTHLRRYFPYLEVVNKNKILCKVHPNCRCWLLRVSFED